MIPKTIHYCWFGKTEKDETILKCLESWKEHAPGYSINEWNEENFDVDGHPFTKKMYEKKKWAFVSDYARLDILSKHGGFYLDTDMLLVRTFDLSTSHDCVLGEEAPGTISAGMIGAVSNHPFITLCKNYYDSHEQELMTIPRVLSKVYAGYSEKQSIKVFPPKTFYPFDSENIQMYRGQDLGPDVIGVHLWNYSWGSPLNKLFKRLRVHALGVRLAEALGIKQFLKRLLGFI